jgi:hypothetical protein
MNFVITPEQQAAIAKQRRAEHEANDRTRKDDHFKRTLAVLNRAPVASAIAEFAMTLTGDDAAMFTNLARAVLRLEVKTGEMVRSVDAVADVLGLPAFEPHPFREMGE